MGEIQEIAEKITYAWNRSDHSDGSGLIRLDRMTAIEAKLDAVMNIIGEQ